MNFTNFLKYKIRISNLCLRAVAERNASRKGAAAVRPTAASTVATCYYCCRKLNLYLKRRVAKGVVFLYGL